MVDADSELARLGARLFFTLLCIRPRVLGRRNLELQDGPSLVVCRSRSVLDPLLLLGYLPDPCRFLRRGAPESSSLPAFVERRLDNLWIPRDASEKEREEALLGLRRRARVLEVSLVVFRDPSLDDLVLELARGSDHSPPMPVLPCRLRGTEEVAPPGVWVPRFAPVSLEIGPPLGCPPTPEVLDQALEAVE